MEELRLPAVAARLVAWHNRHPLARRITAAQVHAVGYVALPFVGINVGINVGIDVAVDAGKDRAAATAAESPPAVGEVAQGVSLRERALARARQQEPAVPPAPDGARATVPQGPLQPDFSENFIDPLTPRQVARFAAQAGQPLARAPGDGPLRLVRADGAHSGCAVVPLYLLTAAIETGTSKSRVLLGGGAQAAVLGQRIWSPPRVGAVLAVLALSLAALVMALRAAAPHPAAAAAAATAAVVADAAHGSAEAPGSASGVAPVAASAAEPAPAPAAAPAPAPAPAAAHTAAPEVAPEPAHTGASAAMAPAPDAAASMPIALSLPSIRPQISAQAKAAARQARTDARPQADTAAVAASTATFALSTRALRTHAEAQQVQVAMQSLLKTVGATQVKVDLLPEGDDWRVVGWPFAQRGDADKARALLVSRGMRVQVVVF